MHDYNGNQMTERHYKGHNCGNVAIKLFVRHRCNFKREEYLQ